MRISVGFQDLLILMNKGVKSIPDNLNEKQEDRAILWIWRRFNPDKNDIKGVFGFYIIELMEMQKVLYIDYRLALLQYDLHFAYS